MATFSESKNPFIDNNKEALKAMARYGDSADCGLVITKNGEDLTIFLDKDEVRAIVDVFAPWLQKQGAGQNRVVSGDEILGGNQ